MILESKIKIYFRTRLFWFTTTVVIIATGIAFLAAATAYSVWNELKPPENLTSIESPYTPGEVVLKWNKPKGDTSELIGYLIYRNNTRVDYVIGADTLDYHDDGDDNLGLAADTNYTYFVKAVYLGVPEEDLPSSNTASVFVYSLSCDDECVQNNPFTVTKKDEKVVSFGPVTLNGVKRFSNTISFNLPAGRYQVYTHSFDNYRGRKKDRQSNEKWFLVLSNNGKEIAFTNSTPDLPDGSDATTLTSVIETELVLSQAVNQIKAVHAGVLNGDGFDDVGVSAVMFVPIDSSVEDCFLVVNKTADKEVVAPGDYLTYTITVENKGASNCTGGGNYIFDTLPPELTYEGESHNSSVEFRSYDQNTHTGWWVATTPLVPGEVAEINLLTKVRDDLSSESCQGNNNDGSPGGEATDSRIVNQIYVTNNQYANRAIPVYSNLAITQCDSTPEEPQIEATIAPTPNPSYPGGVVNWKVTPYGECPGPFSYAWTGDDGLSGNTASINHVYNKSGSYLARVSISAPGCEPATVESPTPVIVRQSEPDSITCEADPKVVEIGKPVLWRVKVNPPAPPEGGNYSFSWSGDDNLSGNGVSVSKIYNKLGTKTARVDVVDVGSIPDCVASVRVISEIKQTEF
jgi:uncharacterized repeat protein (TIGR01451 family)